jgi:hypothetical protein
MSQPPQPFRALSLSYDLIEALSSVIPAIREHDASLADQLRRAAQSVALNLAESTGNSRGNRRSRIETACVGIRARARCRQSRGIGQLHGLTSASPCPIPLRTGSTQETKAALHIARCWRYVDEATIRRAFDLADDIAKLCWRLTR